MERNENKTALDESLNSASDSPELSELEESVQTQDSLDTEEVEEEEKKKRRKWPLLLLLLLLLFAAIAGGAWWYISSQPVDDGMEPNVIVGPMEDMTDEELQKLLNDKLSEGMLGFSLNTGIVFENATAEGYVMFENPANNAKLTKLEIVRDDNGETIYTTGFLTPGSYVEKDTLDVQLEPGSYTCTAYISSYKEATKAFIGKAAAEVTIVVK